MKVLINDNEYQVKINDTLKSKLCSLINKKELKYAYLYQNENKVNTFFVKTLVDIIGINKKNAVIFKYLNAPKNKIIEIINDKENTDILILPKTVTQNIKIGDILTFINEDIV